MSTIVVINPTDVIANSRADLNTNFSNLNAGKEEVSNKDIDTTLAANSDTKYPSQKAIKAYVDSVASPTGKSWNNFVADAGSTDAYTITITGYAAYTTGDTFKFKANTANTGACSLKVNGLLAIPIKKDVLSDLATGDILANQIVTVIYDGTNMQLQSQESGIRKTTDTIDGATLITGLIPAVNLTMLSSAGVGNPPATSSTQTITHGLGRIPKIIRIKGSSEFDNYSVAPYNNFNNTSDGIYNSSGNRAVYSQGTGVIPAQTSISFAIFVTQAHGANTGSGIIQNVTATTFDIVWTVSATVVSCAYLWEAE